MKVICKVKKILAKKGLTQTWLSHKTGISKGQLGDIVNNRYNKVSLYNAKLISDALDTPIEELWKFVKD